MTRKKPFIFFLPIASGIFLAAPFYLPAAWPLVFIALVPLILFLERYAGNALTILAGAASAFLVMDAIILVAFRPTSYFLEYFTGDVMRFAPAWMRSPVAIEFELGALWLLFSIWFALAPIGFLAAGYAFFKKYLSTDRSGWASFFLFPTLWTLGEFGRALISTGFTFGHIGYKVVDFLPLAITSRVWGIYGVGFIIAMANQFIARIVVRKADRTTFGAGFFILGIIILGFLSAKREVANGWEGEVRRAVVTQGGISYGGAQRLSLVLPKPTNASLLPPSYETLVSFVPFGTDLLVMPEGISEETISPRVPYSFSRAQDFFSGELVRDKKLGAALVGHDVIDPDSLRASNAIIAWGKSGMEGMYRKRVLFIFGEYFPILQTLFPQVFPPIMSYVPGPENQGIVQTNVGRLGVVICQEANLPGLLRADINQGAELLINSGSEWQFGKFVQEEQLRIARFRALESKRYLLRAMKAGTSAIINPLGQIVMRPRSGSDVTMLEGEVKLIRDITPYSRFGDHVMRFLWIGAAVFVGVSLRRRTPKRI